MSDQAAVQNQGADGRFVPGNRANTRGQLKGKRFTEKLDALASRFGGIDRLGPADAELLRQVTASFLDAERTDDRNLRTRLRNSAMRLFAKIEARPVRQRDSDLPTLDELLSLREAKS